MSHIPKTSTYCGYPQCQRQQDAVQNKLIRNMSWPRFQIDDEANEIDMVAKAEESFEEEDRSTYVTSSGKGDKCYLLNRADTTISGRLKNNDEYIPL